MSERPHLDPDRLRRARAYRAFLLRATLGQTAAGVLVLVALHLAGAGVAARSLVGVADVGRAEDAARIYLLVSVFIAIGWVVELPFAYATWARGRLEGIVVQSLASAFADRMKAWVLTLVFVGIPLTAWYVILPRAEWWLLTIVGVAMLAALGMLLGPAISALFFRFDPLADATVADRVRAVAERAGVRVSGVYRMGLGAKTTAANAGVLGLGPTKRIALGDTLLSKFPIDEVEAVVAHEVGHDVTGDPARYVVAFTAFGSGGLIAVRVVVDALTGEGAVRGAADPASYPLVAAAFGALALAARPAFMAFTRWRERAADAFGARHTSREAMARALVRLAGQNLADPEPPRWEEVFFYSHPAIANRVRALGLRWEEFAAPA